MRHGAKAPEAAGVIHTDFERGFIRAEVMRCEDLVELGSEASVKQAGKLRVEGKDYRAQYITLQNNNYVEPDAQTQQRIRRDAEIRGRARAVRRVSDCPGVRWSRPRKASSTGASAATDHARDAASPAFFPSSSTTGSPMAGRPSRSPSTITARSARGTEP